MSCGGLWVGGWVGGAFTDRESRCSWYGARRVVLYVGEEEEEEEMEEEEEQEEEEEEEENLLLLLLLLQRGWRGW